MSSGDADMSEEAWRVILSKNGKRFAVATYWAASRADAFEYADRAAEEGYTAEVFRASLDWHPVTNERSGA